MSPVYDFSCGHCGQVTERRAGTDLQAILCPICGKTAQRVSANKGIHIIGDTVAKGGR